MKKKRGFTLIELLLYVTISSVILLITTLFLQTLLESRIKNSTIAEVDQQGIQVMQIITQTIRNADEIISPAPGNSSRNIKVQTDSIETEFDLVTNPNSVNKIIRMREDGGNWIKLTNKEKVEAFKTSNQVFINLSQSDTPGTIRIEFTLTYVNNSGKNEYNYSKTFYGSATLRQQQ